LWFQLFIGIDVRVVPAAVDDAVELCDLINAIIARGGTTAYQVPFTPDSFLPYYITGTHVISCFKAIDEDGRALGFQGLGHADYVPSEWGDIGTFTRIDTVQRGVGTALFQETKCIATAKRIPTLSAIIRADNAGGLAYYTKLGFVTYDVLKAIPLADGIKVDRFCKKLALV
jgi:L-amino acid N-acyltransferase YncA